MFIIFFLLWIVFNERLTLEVAGFGVVISAVLYLFMVKFMDYHPRSELTAVKKIPGALKYVYTLVKEILKANMGVMRFILSPVYEVEPQLVYFKTELKNDVTKVVLANSVTLTPGTITVALEEDVMCVHCLDKSMAEGLEHSDFEKQLAKLEEDGK